MKSLLSAIVAVWALAAQTLPFAAPEREGISAERLSRLHATIEKAVAQGKRSGAITMFARNGRIVDWRVYGYRDIEAKLPMERDTICLAYSMTKPVTSAAVLMLMEEGRFELSDPIARYIPELRTLKVFAGGTAGKPELVDPKRPVTIKDLLTHSSGMVYGGIYGGKPTPVHMMYQAADVFSALTLKGFVERVAALPLICHPGEAFHYGVSTDVLGYLVEVVSGIPFEQFLAERVFEPLRMHDTHFRVPEEKRGRLAKVYQINKTGRLEAMPENNLKFPSGGGGLRATTGDYARFAQMLLNRGTLDGARLLGRKTVELMMANHVSQPVTLFNPGDGFGLGGSVRVDLAKGGTLGSVGDFGWAGAASTWFRIDPAERTVMLLFMQHMPLDVPMFRTASTLFYQALVD